MPGSRQRYDYVVEEGSMALRRGTIQDILDERANEGYQLVDIVKQKGTMNFIFERPIEN